MKTFSRVRLLAPPNLKKSGKLEFYSCLMCIILCSSLTQSSRKYLPFFAPVSHCNTNQRYCNPQCSLKPGRHFSSFRNGLANAIVQHFSDFIGRRWLEFKLLHNRKSQLAAIIVLTRSINFVQIRLREITKKEWRRSDSLIGKCVIQCFSTWQLSTSWSDCFRSLTTQLVEGQTQLPVCR